MSSLRRPFLSLSLTTILAACGSAEHLHWGYEDSETTVGPEGWGMLEGNATCMTGKQQTPIALSTRDDSAARSVDLPPLNFDYKPSKLTMVHNGHTVVVTYDPGSTFTPEGEALRLAQFHFHSTSEHTLDGAYLPLEMHLVHVDKDSKPKAVVAVLVRVGAPNAVLATAWKNLPQQPDAATAPMDGMTNATIDAAQLLPARREYFTYAGSLTTPPCTEGLTWYVFKNSVEMSVQQLTTYVSIPGLAKSNRPLQPLNGRSVWLDSTP